MTVLAPEADRADWRPGMRPPKKRRERERGRKNNRERSKGKKECECVWMGVG
jgi:hypothetical protein